MASFTRQNPNSHTRIATPKAFVTLGVFYLTYMMSSFFKVSANIVMPMYIDSLGITAGLAGVIAGMYYVGYGIMQLFAGPVATRYGSPSLMAAGELCAALGALLFAFAPSPWALALARFLVGLGVGPTFLSIITYISEEFPARLFAQVSGVSVAMSGFGAAVASAPLKAVIDAWGTRPTFMVLAGLLCTLSIALTLLHAGDTRKRVSSLKVSAPSNKSAPTSGEAPANAKANTASGGIMANMATAWRVIKASKALLYASTLWILYNSIQHAYQGLWSAKWYADTFESVPLGIGFGSTALSIGLMFGTVLSEKCRGKGLSRGQSTHRAEVLFGLSLVVLALTHSLWAVKVAPGQNTAAVVAFVFDWACGFAVGHICIQQTAYIKDLSPTGLGTTTLGLMNAGASAGSMALQALTGHLHDITAPKVGSSNAFVAIFGTFGLLSLGIAIAAKKTRK